MDDLILRLEAAGLMENDLIVLEFLECGGAQVVSQEDFENFFGAALQESDQYTALIAADANADDTCKGYSRFFNTWHEASII